MAKKPADFRTNSLPQYNPEEGTSFSNIFSKALGKKEGEALTIDDIKSLAGKAGLSRRDTRRVIKGGQNFLSSGKNFMLKDDGYNVFNKDNSPETTASREAGDKKGFNIGDLVALGRNTSSLAGLARIYQQKQSSEVKTPTTVPGGNVTSGNQKSAGNSDEKPKVSGGEKNRKMTPAEQLAFNAKLEAMKKRTEKYVQGSSQQPTPYFIAKPEEKKISVGDWYPGLPTDKPSGKGKDISKSEATFLNQFAPSFVRGAINLPATTLRTPVAVADLINMASPGLIDTDKFVTPKWADAYEENVTNSKVGKYLTQGYDENGKWYTHLPEIIPGLALTKKVTPFNPIKPLETVTKVGTRLVEKGVNTAAKTAAEYTKAGVRVATKKGWKPSIADKIVKPTLQTTPTKTKLPIKDAIGRRSQLEKMMMQMDEGFRKGGKLPMGGDGFKFFSFDPLNPEGKLNISKYIGKFNQNGQKSEATPFTSPAGATAFQDRALTFGKGDGSETGGGEGKFGDIAGKVAKYALPFIGEGLARNELDKVKPVNYTPANFMTGEVYDMPRPNFKLRSREPLGNDLQSTTAAAKFGDAQERDAMLNWENANAASKIQQKQGIVDRTNQAAGFNAQMKLQTDLSNSNLNSWKANAKAESMREPFVAAQHHLATDISTGAYMKADKQSALAEEILKRPENHGGIGSDDWNWAKGYLRGKKGLKFR